jgi:hypothetical protein
MNLNPGQGTSPKHPAQVDGHAGIRVSQNMVQVLIVQLPIGF